MMAMRKRSIYAMGPLQAAIPTNSNIRPFYAGSFDGAWDFRILMHCSGNLVIAKFSLVGLARMCAAAVDRTAAAAVLG